MLERTAWRSPWLAFALLIVCSPSSADQASAVVLEKYEKSVFSQGGEDGVIQQIFEVIEPTTKYAVEFGAGDGVRNSNVRNLFLNHGWSGLQIEGDPKLYEKLLRNYSDIPKVKNLWAWVWPGNVEFLFEENGVPEEFDFLVIDIDSNDYWVWKVIHRFRPKVVQIEFNGAFAPPERAVVAYHPFNYWDGTDYHGASIQSLYDLGKTKGYELIYCNQFGNNLFFVDREYYARFGIGDNSPARIYRPPSFGLKSGGRAPNGRGLRRSETLGPLTYSGGTIRKRFVRQQQTRPAQQDSRTEARQRHASRASQD